MRSLLVTYQHKISISYSEDPVINLILFVVTNSSTPITYSGNIPEGSYTGTYQGIPGVFNTTTNGDTLTYTFLGNGTSENGSYQGSVPDVVTGRIALSPDPTKAIIVYSTKVEFTSGAYVASGSPHYVLHFFDGTTTTLQEEAVGTFDNVVSIDFSIATDESHSRVALGYTVTNPDSTTSSDEILFHYEGSNTWVPTDPDYVPLNVADLVYKKIQFNDLEILS